MEINATTHQSNYGGIHVNQEAVHLILIDQHLMHGGELIGGVGI